MTTPQDPDATDDRRPIVRPVLSAREQADQAILDEAASRRARGERVKALRGVDDGRLRIYTRAEAGPAWTESSSSRAVFSVTGLLLLFALISAILIVLIVCAIDFGPDGTGEFVVGFVIVGAVWLCCAVVLGRAIVAKALRRRRGLPDPVPGSGHLGQVLPR